MGGLISSIYGRAGYRPVDHQSSDASGYKKPMRERPHDVPGKTWLNVPYRDKNQAKKNGARWDKRAKWWYAPNPAPLDLRARLNYWWPKGKNIA